jgi:hypothetical protein
VERHAALPELKYLHRMLHEVAEIVEQHIAGAAAEDDAQRHPQHVVVELRDRDRRRPAPELLGAQDFPRVDPAEHDAGDIGQRIPANGERSEADGNRIEFWKRQHKERHSPSKRLRGDGAS